MHTKYSILTAFRIASHWAAEWQNAWANEEWCSWLCCDLREKDGSICHFLIFCLKGCWVPQVERAKQAGYDSGYCEAKQQALCRADTGTLGAQYSAKQSAALLPFNSCRCPPAADCTNSDCKGHWQAEVQRTIATDWVPQIGSQAKANSALWLELQSRKKGPVNCIEDSVTIPGMIKFKKIGKTEV